MSSIRPLAIITVLTVLCVFLYFKINETEPVLPADVAEWSMSPGLEIGGDSSAASSAPAFASSSTTDTAAPAFGDFPSGNEAPTFNSNPMPQETPPPAANTDVAVLEMPDLPALPAISTTNLDTNSDALVASTPPVTPTTTTPGQVSQESLFAATRIAMQAALDRGELSQALLLLSDWHGDPSLSKPEKTEVDSLLGQLAGSVIYSKQHRLEPPHMVQAGEKLQAIAQQYNVPWQLLAKINGLASPEDLRPGQQLKVVQGPFSALIDLSDQKMIVMLQRRYAGQFDLAIAPQSTVEEGHWQVDQKLLTPGNTALQSSLAAAHSEDRSLLLSNPSANSGQVAILHGSSAGTSSTAVPPSRAIQLNANGIEEVFDILSVGSRVVIRR